MTRFLPLLCLGIFVAMVASMVSAQVFKTGKEAEVEERAAQRQEPLQQAPISNVSAAAVYATCKDYFQHKFNSALRENVGRKSSCVSYFFGATSMVLLLNNDGVETGICPPADLSTDAVIKLFIRWMEQNPDRRNEVATIALYDALSYRFPCDGVVPLGSE